MRFSFSDGKALQFSILCIVPVIIGLRISDHSEYVSFIEGKNSEPLLDVLQSHNIAISLCNSLLDNNETYDEARGSETKKVVQLKDKLQQVYEALFIHDFEKDYTPIMIGDTSFDKDTRNEVLRIASGFSNFVSFE